MDVIEQIGFRSLPLRAPLMTPGHPLEALVCLWTTLKCILDYTSTIHFFISLCLLTIPTLPVQHDYCRFADQIENGAQA
jgi:hypothetical protein